MHPTQALLALAAAAATITSAQGYDVYPTVTALSGTLSSSQSNIIGNYYNYWRILNNGTTYDLARFDRLPTSSPKTIPMIGFSKGAVIEPSRTAFVIVDMQEFCLSPGLSPSTTKGRNAVGLILRMIDAFRENGMRVLFVNWGIDEYDLVTMPPSFWEGFSSDGTVAASFCQSE